MKLPKLSPESFHFLVGRLLEIDGYTLLRSKPSDADVALDFTAKKPGHSDLTLIEWSMNADTEKLKRCISALNHAKAELGAKEQLLILGAAPGKRGVDLLKEHPEITVWDKERIEALIAENAPLRSELTFYINQQLRYGSATPIHVQPGESSDDRAETLRSRLTALSPGRDTWRAYEELCVDLLSYLFTPPFGIPQIQSRSEDGLDIRDAIFPLSTGTPFWDVVRSEFSSRFVVAEFKNFSDELGQKEVESIQQYLFVKARRSFGILCGRKSPSHSALAARRRAWNESDKLIVFVSDADMLEMLSLRERNGDPSVMLSEQIDMFLMKLAP